jgi:single-strand DNA-binding protein
MSTDVTLTGRLTRDPDLKFSQAGKAVARFAVVTSRRVKDRNTNEWSDADTTFWDCVAFGELANNIAESLEKGTAVVVTGHASQEEWTTKDGEKRKSLKVVAEDVAPSLRWASARVAKAGQQQSDAPKSVAQNENPFANDEPPF